MFFRIGYAVSGLIHASLAASAAAMVFGSGQSGSGDAASKEWTATLLEQPFGRWLVAAAGAGFVIFALAQIYKAFTAKFREKLKTGEMSQTVENFAVRTGRVGLVARGIVFGIIGAFLALAAWRSNAGEARGLSGALHALEAASYGQWLLGVVALGLIAYGFYMFVQARYRRIIL